MPGGKKGTNTKPAAKRCQLKIFHRQFKFTVVFNDFDHKCRTCSLEGKLIVGGSEL